MQSPFPPAARPPSKSTRQAANGTPGGTSATESLWGMKHGGTGKRGKAEPHHSLANLKAGPPGPQPGAHTSSDTRWSMNVNEFNGASNRFENFKKCRKHI